nr:hypothetical protein [Tanacetum cinerariifolium]
MQNPKDISDPTTAIDMALKLMAKAFQLTNPQQQTRTNKVHQAPTIVRLHNQNVRNQNRLSVILGIANQHENGNIVAARVKGNGNGINGNPIRIQFTFEEVDFMAAAGSCEKTERANANCTLENNWQQASTSEERYTELLESIPEPHQVKQNDSNVILAVSNVKQGRGIVEQHSTTIEEKCVYHESLFHNLVAEDEKVKSVIHKLKDSNVELTTELARYENQVERFQAQLGDQKGKSKDTPYVLDTLDPLPQKLKNEKVELEIQYKEVTTAQVEVSAAQELQRKMLIV